MERGRQNYRNEAMSPNRWKHHMLKGVGPDPDKPNRHAPFLRYYTYDQYPSQSEGFTLVVFQMHPSEAYGKNVVGGTLDRFVASHKTGNILFVPQGTPLGVRRLKYFPPEEYADVVGYANKLGKKLPQDFDYYKAQYTPHHDGSGHDLNWSFPFSGRPEVANWQGLFDMYPIEKVLAIHNDPDRENEPYAYIHQPYNDLKPVKQHKWAKFMRSLSSAGAVAFNGLDDDEKPGLCNQVVNGLIASHSEERMLDGSPKHYGSFENFALTKGAKIAITFELPVGLKDVQYSDILMKAYGKFLSPKLDFIQ